MAKRLFVFALQVVIVVLALASGALAQTTSGLITGTVTDSSGAVIPDARVELTNQATGVQRQAATDSSGYYSVPALQPGVYDVAVSKQGFAIEKLANVHLEVNQSEALNFKMSVSASTQTVSVNADVTQINTTSATHAEVVGNTAIVELPLNGRQFNQLTLLTPGAVPLIQGGQQGVFHRQAWSRLGEPVGRRAAAAAEQLHHGRSVEQRAFHEYLCHQPAAGRDSGVQRPVAYHRRAIRNQFWSKYQSRHPLWNQ